MESGGTSKIHDIRVSILHKKKLKFMLIGAGAGGIEKDKCDFFDTIVEKQWICTFIEPIEYAIELLKKSYSHSNKHTYICRALDINNDQHDRHIFYIEEDGMHIDQIHIYNKVCDIPQHMIERGNPVRKQFIKYNTIDQLIPQDQFDVIHLNFVNWSLISQDGFKTPRIFSKFLLHLKKSKVKYLSYDNEMKFHIQDSLSTMLFKKHGFSFINDEKYFTSIEPDRNYFLLKNDNL